MPERLVSCVNCPKRSSCFNELDRADHKFIEENRVELYFNKGEAICKQGSFASNIMFIYSGVVKVYLETANREHTILSVLPAGKMIGLPSLFTDRVFPYSAAAIEDSVICSVDIRIFEDFTKSNGGFASEIIHALNDCTLHFFHRFLSVTNKQVNGRMADVLLHLSETVYGSKQFPMSLSRTELSELTAMSPESVTRVLNKLEQDKVIAIKGKAVTILDIDRLRKISQTG
jgi:CRP/FNR family transcriptional regulator, polysaccharide utilization system transcription regulator